MREQWILATKRGDFDGIARACGISPVTARLLVNRGAATLEDVRRFLNGTLADLADPLTMLGVRETRDRLLLAADRGEGVTIAGDYDADGIFSSVILRTALTRLGIRAVIDVPDRRDEGYGMNLRIVSEALARGDQIILTCDNGVSAFEAIHEAKANGLTVLVTDHHEIPYEKEGEEIRWLPTEADAVVDPHQPGCQYPFKNLCGAGVAFTLVRALYAAAQIPEEETNELLPYAAIATVADVMELSGENRILVREGIARLEKTSHPGLKALMTEQDIFDRQLTEYHLGFILGPCFNAAGRMGRLPLAFSLLEEKDPRNAQLLAQELCRLNNERKELTRRGAKLAEEWLAAEDGLREPVLVAELPEEYDPLAGIIAGRLREAYHKPAFVMVKNQEGYKGSGRSVDQYNMFEALSAMRGLFVHFGGHPMAAGLTVKEECYNEFLTRIRSECGLPAEGSPERVDIDLALPVSYVTRDLIRELDLLAPFGKGNPRPLFARAHLSVSKLSYMGTAKRALKLMVSEGGGAPAEAVFFGDAEGFVEFIRSEFGEEELSKLFAGRPNQVDLALAYTPRINEFRGVRRVQLLVTNYCRIDR